MSVCKACRLAGESNQTAVVEEAEGSQRYEDLLVMAARLHGTCRGKSYCDCQHKTGKWIQAKSS